METTELILTFIADIIHYIAWPAVVITIFVLLAGPIKALIARIKQARVKKGDTEVIFDMMEDAFKSLTEEKPGIILLADVTPENLNWETFKNMTSAFQWILVAYLLSPSVDPGLMEQGDVCRHMRTIEKTCSLLKDDMSADDLAVIQQLRERLAPIMGNPS